MNLFRKKKMDQVVSEQKQEMEYLFETLSAELTSTEKKMDDVSYQIEFFGTTPKLEEEKKDCELMISWLQAEFDEIKKGLFQIQAQSIV